jgi:hypothetical protein
MYYPSGSARLTTDNSKGRDQAYQLRKVSLNVVDFAFVLWYVTVGRYQGGIMLCEVLPADVALEQTVEGGDNEQIGEREKNYHSAHKDRSDREVPLPLLCR